MNINATLFGQFVIVLAIIMAVSGYLLGKRKTHSPVLCAIIGFFSALFPPLSLIFLAALAFKSDIATGNSETQT